MKVYVILAKGILSRPNGSVVFDTKGEWNTIKATDCNETILAFDKFEYAEDEMKHWIGQAKYNQCECEFKVAEFAMI